MARKHVMESTFRLNLLNPQHAKINDVIKGLNPNIYKSKNQFLIEACEYYIDHYGEDEIPTRLERKMKQFVTKDDIEELRKDLENSAMTAARQEVITLLGGTLNGIIGNRQVVLAEPEEESSKEETDDIMEDADVAGLAMSWMSKGD